MHSIHPPSESSHQPPTVLVVDDEATIRYSVSRTLQRIGYAVVEAANGDEALAIVDDRSFDVILTDIRMPPGIDGVELVRRLKERDADSIVILMTGFPSLTTAVEALRLGAHDYLIKPSTSQDIRASVARGVERARSLRKRRVLVDAIRSSVSELTTNDRNALRKSMGEDQTDAALTAGQTTASMPTNAPIMRVGTMMIHTGLYQIAHEEKTIDLTPTEFDLLIYLAAHKGRVVPCGELVREVRGYAVDENEAREVIRPHVSNLRRKLKEAHQDNKLIMNVRGMGYRLNDSDSRTVQDDLNA